MEEKGIEFVIKTRTDTYLNFEDLINSFFREYDKRGDRRIIGTTVSHLPTFLIHDLYFMSETKVLRDFCEAILSFDRFEFIESVHREMILKHAYRDYRREIGVPDWAYFPFYPPTGVCSETRRIFQYMIENIYFSLDSQLFYYTLWRGEYYEKGHIDNLVKPKERIRKYNLPALITTDWRRYYNFREQVYEEKIPATAIIKIGLGEYGWYGWNLVRKVVRYFL